MKRFICAIAALISVTSAHATSLHPCTPTVRAVDSIMHCSDRSQQYSIRIETLMSPRAHGCEGENYYEYHTAYIQVYKNQKPAGKMVIYDADFDYSLGSPGGSDGIFVSPKKRLNLRNCISPVHGGMSFGN